MSVEKLIDELGDRGLLSDRVMVKLREKLSQTERPLSAKAVAKFLVEKKHLTHRQATEVLGNLLRRGVDVDDAVPVGAAGEELGLVHDPDEDEDDAGSSSIFAPFLTGAPKKKRSDRPSAQEPELDSERDRRSPRDTSDASEDERAPLTRQRTASEEDSSVILSRTEPVRTAESDFPAASIERSEVPRTRQRRSSSELKIAKPEPRGKKRPQKQKDEWDSPLILIGGGALVLLVLVGATLAWMLNWESGDEKLRLAQEAIATGSYTQGIAHYQEFLENFPRHRERSVARVELAMARLRKAVEAANFAAALDIAREELDAVEDEEKFAEAAHGELASLLPRIAIGLANEAEVTTDPSAAQQLVDQSSTALALAGNTKYVPKTLRDEGELEVVRETLQRVRRRQQSQQDLLQALAAMEQAISNGDTQAAYAQHRQVVKQHPELTGDAALTDMVRKTSAAEREAIRFVAEEQAAESADRPTPWTAALAVAHRRSSAATATENGTVCVRVDGAAYGLDPASGRVLWRRQVGEAFRAPPMSIGGDVLIIDAARHELLRLNAATGELRWRQTIGEPFAQPLVVGERGFVAGESGRLFVVDLASGARLGYLQFAQPIRVPPAANPHQQRLYLTGDHSSLYSIALADLTCAGVYYLGHAEGSVRVPPALVLDKLAVMENDGVETSRLHLLALDDSGTVSSEVADRRLAGSATSAPLVAGRRMVVVTDRGQIDVFDIASNESDEALTLIASRAAAGKHPIARHAAIVGNHIWVGDTQLTKFAVSPTGNRMPVVSIADDFARSLFDHPLQPAGNTLIHVHRPNGRAGVVVAATDTAQGKTLWKTRLAMPPAGPPIIDPAAKALTVANAEGYVFRFDDAAIRSRVQDQPLAAQSAPANPPPLSVSVNLGQGRAAFGAPGSDQLLLYNPAQHDRPLQWVKLPSPLACAMTPMGDGLIAPLQVGQVFYLSAADGTALATPFQPPLQPRTTMNYAPAGVVESTGRQFVIADGNDKLFLVGLAERPSPHLEKVAEAAAGPYPIRSPIVVVGDTALAVAGDSHIARFRLPALEPAGESSLAAPVVWGPFRAGNAILVATADQHLVLISPTGEELWRVALEHTDLTGEPFVTSDSTFIAYRDGTIERRALSDGKLLAAADVEHSLAAGPVEFLQRLVVTANDGTLLVVERP